jgi:hypothetical protein
VTVSVGIACPVLDNSNPAWREDWGAWSPGYRRQVLDAMAAVGILGAAQADPNSWYPPDLSYPIGHPCHGRGGDQAGIGGVDEGERARADQALRRVPSLGEGWLPLPGLGLLGAAPDWLKWLAIAAVALGVVLVVRRRGRE